MRDWGQIEDESEIANVLRKIQTTPAFDVYTCAEDYELAYPGYNGDKIFYLEKANTGRVLYLGVGAGRIFGEIAKWNSEAIGVDNSAEMLELLRRNCPHIKKGQLVFADALDGSFINHQFDVIVAPYSFLQIFGGDHLSQLLQNIYNWLKPGGMFYTDTFSPYLIPFRRKGLEVNTYSTDKNAKISIYILYNHEQQTMTEMTLINKNGTERVMKMYLHYYFPREIISALHDAGFKSSQVTGDYSGKRFDPSENDIIVYESQKKIPVQSLRVLHRK